MKRLFLLLLFMPLLACNKYPKDKKFEACRDSLNKHFVKLDARNKSKILLEYHLGITPSEFKVISEKLWLAGLIDESNHYKFQYEGLEDVKFRIEPNYHNDSLKAISLYNSEVNRFGGNVDDIFSNLNSVLSERYQQPVCRCNTNSIWLYDGKYIESSINDKNVNLLIEDLFFKNNGTYYYHFTDTYDSVYYNKVVRPREMIIKKLEKIKASKDL